MSPQDLQKQAVARAAIAYVVDDAWIGVGSGSTANFFIDELATIKHRIKGTVASSVRTAERLKSHHILVEELNNVDDLPVYIDGADEVTAQGAMTKGGGGALTREKIVAAVAQKFVCIADQSKLVTSLGAFPVPVEVIPMARSHVARQFVRMGARPVLRSSFVTDNGNVILDVHDLAVDDPERVEDAIDRIVGIVTVGVFARRGADVILLAGDDGVRMIEPPRPGRPRPH